MCCCSLCFAASLSPMLLVMLSESSNSQEHINFTATWGFTSTCKPHWFYSVGELYTLPLDPDDLGDNVTYSSSPDLTTSTLSISTSLLCSLQPTNFYVGVTFDIGVQPFDIGTPRPKTFMVATIEKSLVLAAEKDAAQNVLQGLVYIFALQFVCLPVILCLLFFTQFCPRHDQRTAF